MGHVSFFWRIHAFIHSFIHSVSHSTRRQWLSCLSRPLGAGGDERGFRQPTEMG